MKLYVYNIYVYKCALVAIILMLSLNIDCREIGRLLESLIVKETILLISFLAGGILNKVCNNIMNVAGKPQSV